MQERSEYEQEIHRLIQSYRDISAEALRRKINEESVYTLVQDLFRAIEDGLVVISRQIEGRPARET